MRCNWRELDERFTLTVEQPWASLDRDYADVGAVTLKELLNSDGVAAIRDWLGTVVARGRSIPASFEPEFEAGTDAVRKLRRLYWNDEAFWGGVFNQSGLPEMACRFVGRPVVLTFHAAFTKPSAVGTRVALHQDQALWTHQYPGAVSVWVALTPANRHNGGLIGCPGSHRRGPITHRDEPDHPWHGGVDWRGEGLGEPVPYDLDPGDALLWHRDFVHGSGANASAESRWGVVMVFVDRTQASLHTRDRADF